MNLLHLARRLPTLPKPRIDPGGLADATETVLGADGMDAAMQALLALWSPPGAAPAVPARSTAELALEAGSQRVYAARDEAEVIEARRNR